MVEYVVKLTIDNRARRVPFRFTDGSVALFDPNDGKRYRVDPEAQRAYEAATGQKQPDPLILKAGESATRDYVFRLPAGVTDPRLRIAPGGWGGMVLEKLLFGAQGIPAPVNEAIAAMSDARSEAPRTRPAPYRPAWVLAGLYLFGIGFGFVEAAVVVDLRAILGPGRPDRPVVLGR